MTPVEHPYVVVVMGVMCIGKSFYGQQLAEKLGWSFYEADNAHPPENKKKMRTGQALNDDDRAGWLSILTKEIRERTAQKKYTVMTCSALKKKYRDQLRSGGPVLFLFLDAPKDEIAARCDAREHEYMDPGLLDSQLNTLERPDESEAVIVDTSGTEDEGMTRTIQAIVDTLHLEPLAS